MTNVQYMSDFEFTTNHILGELCGYEYSAAMDHPVSSTAIKERMAK